MRILIPGSRGLVGSNLYKRLLEEGHSVYGMDLVEGCDLRDKVKVDALMQKISPDYVYMLAAEASESTSQTSPIHMTENNSGIFVNVLTSAINAGVKKFLYTSSAAVYGEANVPYKEDGPTIPKDVYGVNKLACEQMLKIMAKVHGFKYTIFRPHNIYGEGQNMSDPTRNVVALFMRNIIEKRPYKLFGNGEMRRAFSYVGDVVEVLVEALSMKFDNITLNVGSCNDISIKELSDMIQEIAGTTAEIEYLNARPQEITMFLADHETQNNLTSYKETPIKEGLQKTWDWLQEQRLLPIITREKEIHDTSS